MESNTDKRIVDYIEELSQALRSSKMQPEVVREEIESRILPRVSQLRRKLMQLSPSRMTNFMYIGMLLLTMGIVSWMYLKSGFESLNTTSILLLISFTMLVGFALRFSATKAKEIKGYIEETSKLERACIRLKQECLEREGKAEVNSEGAEDGEEGEEEEEEDEGEGVGPIDEEDEEPKKER